MPKTFEELGFSEIKTKKVELEKPKTPAFESLGFVEEPPLIPISRPIQTDFLGKVRNRLTSFVSDELNLKRMVLDPFFLARASEKGLEFEEKAFVTGEEFIKEKTAKALKTGATPSVPKEFSKILTTEVVGILPEFVRPSNIALTVMGGEVFSVLSRTPAGKATLNFLKKQTPTFQKMFAKNLVQRAVAEPEIIPERVTSQVTAEIPSALSRRKPLLAKVESASNLIKFTQTKLVDLNQRARIALQEAEAIGKTGTLTPEVRVPFKEAGPKPETFKFQFSQEDIEGARQEVISVANQITKLRQSIEVSGDAASVNTARALDNALNQARHQANISARKFSKLRFAAGRAVKTFDQPVPEEVLQALREANVLVEGLTVAKQRLPIYTNIIQSLKRFPSLSDAEKAQFGRDLVDAWRLNLFAVHSWTLDLVGNASELTAQTAGAVGRDIGHAVQGRLTFPSLRGLFRAFRPMRLPQEIAEEVGEKVVGGEIIRGGFGEGLGTFTTRKTVGSAAVDYLVGSPLYAKGVIDKGARRFAATATLWRDALEEAQRQGLKGLAKRDFLKNFITDPPEFAIANSIAQAQKAGFSRELSRWEEALSRSVLYRLFGAAFGRWPFQFTRAAGEWLGYNPSLLRRFVAGQARPEEIFEYLAKSSSGWGGLYLINESLYDNIDFNSMEYVHENGNRTRLSNRDPISTALWFLATIKGDLPRSTAALKFASIPGAGALSGEGGLMTSTMKAFMRAVQNADFDARSVRREWDSTLNRLIPGQAVLSFIKSVIDPVIREGVGANIPFVSKTLPPVISSTTGEPLQPRQRIPGLGVEVPTVVGSVIPGAERILDPAHQLLSKYGLLVFRGPRQPIADTPPSELPIQLRNEWLSAFGKYRSSLLTKISEGERFIQLGEQTTLNELLDQVDETENLLFDYSDAADVQDERRRTSWKSSVTKYRNLIEKYIEEPPDHEGMRQLIQAADSVANQLANWQLKAKYGDSQTIERKKARRELAGPRKFEEIRRRQLLFENRQKQEGEP